MSGPSSTPPPQPSSSAPAPADPARHEHVLELDAGGKGWKRRRSGDFLKLSPAGMELHHGGPLREPLAMPLGAIAVAGGGRPRGAPWRGPLAMPLGAIAVAAAEVGVARALPGEGRFPVLRRL